MRGDYSRLTFRPENHYSGVRLQQGRVQLDADFNEQVDIEAHRDQMTALDTIGRHGVPLAGGGFAVSVATNLLGAAFASANDVWAVGEDGAVLRSTDGGQNWALQPPPPGPTARLEAIAFRGATDAHAVGSRGTILALSGTTWTSQGNPALTLSDLHAVTFADPTHGWAVGNGGTILFWNGTSWARQHAQDVMGSLRGVHFISATRGWVVGDNGLILTTSNGGTTWTSQTSGIGTSLRGVHFQSATLGYAVGSSATILVTTDGGTTWTKEAAPQGVTANLAAVRSTSATDVVAVGNGGTVLTSSDAGQTWTLKQPAATSANLRRLAASGASLVAVGDGAVVRGTVPGAWSAATRPANGRTLSFSPGDLYVEGLRVVNERRTTFTSQPSFPFDVDQLPASEHFPPADGTWGLYLRAREMHVTALERDELREKALGGPDTASRTQTVWQLRMKQITAANPTCADFDFSIPPEPASSGTLRARSQPDQVATDECMVPAGGGYRRLENQLYRVEIHDTAANPANHAVKWSRDNGAIAARMEAVTTASTGLTGSVTVSTARRDGVLGFAPKQILELTDEGRVLRGQPGVLVEITGVRGKIIDFKLDVAQQLTLANFPHAPTVRRWDGTIELAAGGGWKALEQGLEIQFSAGPFRNGDWWTIPARTLTASVEWPRNGSGPEFRPPEGVVSYFAPLAIADVAGGVWSNVRDCRRLFPPLTGMVRLYYVGGDGQSVMPDMPLNVNQQKRLPQQLEVGVANGRQPVVGAKVKFELGSGQGRLQLGSGSLDTSVTATTDSNGIARCWWWLDGQNKSQQVVARLIDPLAQSPPAVIHFNGQLCYADEVGYDPTGCGALANQKTVQDAIDTLARLVRIYPLTESGEDVFPGQSVEARVLVADDCGPVNGATVQFAVGGQSTPPGRGNGTLANVVGTTQQGVASCRWTPDPNTPTQDLSATVTAVPAGKIIHQPPSVRLVANLSLARTTQYVPACDALAGAGTVQEAIDGLATLPRLYQVSGDGAHAAPGQRVHLEVAVASDCGPEDNDRFVGFVVHEGDGELAAADVPTGDGRAATRYVMGTAKRHLIEARLIREGADVFEPPVFFTITRVDAGEVAYKPGCEPLAQADVDNVQEAITELCKLVEAGGGGGGGSLRVTLERTVLENVDDAAGRWQFEGGRVLDDAGSGIGEYASYKRVIFGVAEELNSAMVTTTLFFIGATPPENVTLQGVHNFNSGDQNGSVSAASASHRSLIAESYTRVADVITIGSPAS